MDITYCCRTDCQDIRCPRHQFNAPSGDIGIADLESNNCFVGCSSAYTGLLREPTTEMLHIKDLAEMKSETEQFDFETLEAIKFSTPCLICGDDVADAGWGMAPKVCDRCKTAVMHLRKTLGI